MNKLFVSTYMCARTLIYSWLRDSLTVLNFYFVCMNLHYFQTTRKPLYAGSESINKK